MSDTLLMLCVDRLNIFASSSSVMLDEDPILDFLSKQVFLDSSMGEGGMKVTSSFSRGLMVTVMIGWVGEGRILIGILLLDLRSLWSWLKSIGNIATDCNVIAKLNFNQGGMKIFALWEPYLLAQYFARDSVIHRLA